MIAASIGAPRDQWPSWLAELSIDVRSEWTGEFIDDFQTINPRDEDLEYQQRAYSLMTGKRWVKSAHFTPDGEGGTSIVRRTYLANAEFIVAISSESHFDELVAALRAPKFSTYLGRKAFAPVFPFYLGVGNRTQIESLPTIERTGGSGKKNVRDEKLPGNASADEAQAELVELRIDSYLPGNSVSSSENLTVPSQVLRGQNVEKNWRTVSVPNLSRDSWIEAVGGTLQR